MSNKEPVLIVGAGPAGLTLAYLLRVSGVECKVIGHRDVTLSGLEMLSHKTCELMFSLFGSDYPLIRDSSSYVDIHDKKGKRMSLLRLKRMVHFIDKEEFVQWLEELAQVEIIRDNAVSVNASKKIVCCASGAKYSYSLLVGADGANNVVRNTLYSVDLSSNYMTATNIDHGECKVPRIYTGVVKHGYAYVMPSRYGEVAGVYGVTGGFEDVDKKTMLLFRKLGAESLRAPIYHVTCGKPVKVMAKQDSLVIGASSGLSDPLGINSFYVDLKTAQFAADAILSGWDIVNVYRLLTAKMHIKAKRLKFIHKSMRSDMLMFILFRTLLNGG